MKNEYAPITINIPWYLPLIIAGVMYYYGVDKLWVFLVATLPITIRLATYSFFGWVVLRAIKLKKIQILKIEDKTND